MGVVWVVEIDLISVSGSELAWFFMSRSKMTCLQFLDRKYLGFRSGHRYGLDIRVGIEMDLISVMGSK